MSSSNNRAQLTDCEAIGRQRVELVRTRIGSAQTDPVNVTAAHDASFLYLAKFGHPPRARARLRALRSELGELPLQATERRQAIAKQSGGSAKRWLGAGSGCCKQTRRRHGRPWRASVHHWPIAPALPRTLGTFETFSQSSRRKRAPRPSDCKGRKARLSGPLPVKPEPIGLMPASWGAGL